MLGFFLMSHFYIDMNQLTYVTEVVLMHQRIWSFATTLPLKLMMSCALLSVVSVSVMGGCDPLPPQSEVMGDAIVISPPPQPRWDAEVMPDQALELPGPLLNSILPTRAPISGGITVRVIGADFRVPMYVRVGDLPCDELVVENPARMSCIIPRVDTPQVVDFTVAWLPEGLEIDPSSAEAVAQIEGGIRTLPQEFTYYQTLSVTDLSPDTGPASGNTEVVIMGEGFSEPMDVRFGDLPARQVTVDSPQQITVITPASPSGVVDVSIRSAQELARVERGFNFQVPLGIDNLTPRWGSVEGGEPIELYGYGILEDSEVRLGASRATIEQIMTPGRVSALTPPSAEPGWVPLRVENSNGVWLEDRGFLYLATEEASFDVLGLIPQRLPADRGGEFLIGGNGFNEETKVLLDGVEISCDVEAPQRLLCFAPAHPPGEVPVTIYQGLLSRTLSLSFINTLALYQIRPDRAAMSGGALIQIRGRGLTPESRFLFGDVEVPITRFVSTEEVWLRSPPHPVAILDVTLIEADQQVYLPQAFTYFDPLQRYGGAWGDSIQGAVNVTALNIYDFSPIPEASVEVRPFDQPQGPPLVTGLTDAEGQVTLSLEELEGPVHLNIAKSGFEAQTLERVVSENVTVLLFPFTPPEGEGGPPEPPEPAQVSGILTGLNDIPKPREPGFVLRAFVDASHRSMLSRAINPAPAPIGILSEDGPFEILVRPGQMALIGTAAYVPTETLERYERGEMSYWLMRRESRPIKMGAIRFLSLSPGSVIEGLELSLNRDLNQQADVRLLNPSTAAGSIYTDSFGDVQIVTDSHDVRAFLDLGPDGYWEIDIDARTEEPQVQVRGLPDLTQWPDTPELNWFVQSTVHPGGVNSFAYHQQSDLGRSVEIGPFVGAPMVTSHNNGDFFSVGDTISWDLWPGVYGTPVEPPQATTVRFYQAGLPVWTFTLPGGVNQLTIPPLPPAETGAGISEGSVFMILETVTTPDGLNYQDYTLLDLNSPLSYSTSQTELFFAP